MAAHPSFNGCAAAVLQAYYGGDDNSQSFELSYPVAPSTAFGALPPGVTPTRSFTSIAQAEQEGNDARVSAAYTTGALSTWRIAKVA